MLYFEQKDMEITPSQIQMGKFPFVHLDLGKFHVSGLNANAQFYC